MRGVLSRRTRPLAAAAALAAAWAGADELPGQEPADSTRADSAAVVPAAGDSALQARLDSARRMERARRNAVVRSLRPGDRVRVRAEGRVVEGEFLRLAQAHLFLRQGDAGADEAEARAGGGGAMEDRPPRERAGVAVPPDSAAAPTVRRIPVDAMQALWIRLGHPGTGALWGGILGTVGGAVGGYFINEALCNDAEDCIFDSADAAVVFGIGGGLAGTGFGSLIGRGVKEWRQWFPEEEEARSAGDGT